MKCAVVSSSGLGDGLVAACLANNLYINGFEVDMYHNRLHEMQTWFPFSFFPFPEKLKAYDKVFVFYCDEAFVQKLILEGVRNENFRVLNLSFSKDYDKNPFFKDAYFEPNIVAADNIELFCRRVLKLEKTTRSCGIADPYRLSHRKNRLRVIIHPFAAKKGRRWDKRKYLEIYSYLQRKGFDPVFIASEKEKSEWLDGEICSFSSFDKLASFLFESGYMIGNDSGIGHLSSALGLPTLTICRSYRSIAIWRPAWSKGIVLSPSKLIINIKGFRFRDKHWQKFISVGKVKRAFKRLIRVS